MPDACPVCLHDDVVPADCARCGWPLNTGWTLGGRRAAERVFTARLVVAQRAFDLGRAVVAAGFPDRGDVAVLERLQHLLRGGPPAPDELVAARLAATAAPAPVYRPDAPRAGSVVDIEADGVSITRCDQGDGERVERAEVDHRSWPTLHPGLPADPVELRFALAGGVGRSADANAAGAAGQAVARALADALAADPPGMIRTALPGWSVPDLVLGLLRKAHPDAAVGGRAGGSRPVTVRLDRRITAFAAALGPAGQSWTAAGAADGSVAVRGFVGDPVRPVHDARVAAVDIGSDGSIVSGGNDGAVQVWSPATGGATRVVAQHDGWINAVAARRNVAFSLGDDGRLRRSPLLPHEASAANSAYPVDVGWAASSALGVSADGLLVAHGGTDGRVQLRHGVSGQHLRGLPVGVAVVALAVTVDGLLAVAGADGRVVVLHPDQPGRTTPITAAAGPAACLGTGPSGEVVVGGTAGWVWLWRPGAQRGDDGSTVLVGRHTDAVRGAGPGPAGQVVTAGADGLIRTWAVAGAANGSNDVEAP